MRIRRPSPAMAVACTALFISLGGTGIAAVNYARKAGAVDGKSAVSAGSSLARAAGKLVATQRKGDDKGRIPAKFVANVGRANTFGSYVAVTDNQVGAPVELGGVSRVGTLSANCADQSDRLGVEDPITTLTFNNTSGVAINFAKRVGGANAEVIPQLPGTVETITLGGSNTFEIHAQRVLTDIVIHGAVRQDGRATADAKCLVYGTITVVE